LFSSHASKLWNVLQIARGAFAFCGAKNIFLTVIGQKSYYKVYSYKRKLEQEAYIKNEDKKMLETFKNLNLNIFDDLE